MVWYGSHGVDWSGVVWWGRKCAKEGVGMVLIGVVGQQW